jgi:hypothetical protein
MTTSRLFVIALALVGACKKTDKPADPATTGSASGSGSASAMGSAMGSASGSTMGSDAGSATAVGTAAAVDPKACFTLNQGAVEHFVVDDKAATACIKLGDGDTAKTQCLAVDLASGKWSPSTGTPPSKATPAIDVAKLELPKLENSEQYQLETSADGKLVATTAQIGKKSHVVLLDAATGKRTKTWALGDGQGECLEAAHFVGQNVFVITSVCAGPGGTGYVFDRAGKQLAKWDPQTNVYGAQPFHVAGDAWVITEFGGNAFAILDAASGKQTGAFDAGTTDCATCMSAMGPAFSDNAVGMAGGKIVLLSQAGIDVVDATSLKSTKHIQFPLCLTNTAAPTAP